MCESRASGVSHADTREHTQGLRGVTRKRLAVFTQISAEGMSKVATLKLSGEGESKEVKGPRESIQHV